MRSHRSICAFSLIELIASIFILLMVSHLLMHSLSSITAHIKRQQQKATLDECALFIIDYLEQDLSQALIRNGNVPFELTTDEHGNSVLYYVTAGIRRHLETIPRDTAPMHIYLAPSFSQQFQFIMDSPHLGSSTKTLDDLIRLSDYYFEINQIIRIPFMPIHQSKKMAHRAIEYSSVLTPNSAENLAVMTFFNLSVNGDSQWSSLDLSRSSPIYLDVRMGLISSHDLNAISHLSFSEQERALEKYQHIYARRIYVYNRGNLLIPPSAPIINYDGGL